MCERFVKKYRKKRAKMPTPIKKSATLTDEKVSLQEMARKINVNYYANFQVLKCDDPSLPGNEFAKFYFPTAEVYEKGKWRTLVIGGRPYKNNSVAYFVTDYAERTQKLFLKAMYGVKKSGVSLRNLVNPIDCWPYELEM